MAASKLGKEARRRGGGTTARARCRVPFLGVQPLQLAARPSRKTMPPLHMPANAGTMSAGICRHVQGPQMAELPGYKPTLRFNPLETLRIKAAAEQAGMGPAEWMRKLILDNAPEIEEHNPLSVRVEELDEPNGWNFIHYAETLAYAKTRLPPDRVEEVVDYLSGCTANRGGEEWIVAEDLGGVPASDISTPQALAIDLCREIQKAHVRASLM